VLPSGPRGEHDSIRCPTTCDFACASGRSISLYPQRSYDDLRTRNSVQNMDAYMYDDVSYLLTASITNSSSTSALLQLHLSVSRRLRRAFSCTPS